MKKNDMVYKMFWFIKWSFFIGLASLSTLTSVNSLNCISMNNQECKVRPQIANVNSEEPVFFIKISKCKYQESIRKIVCSWCC